MIHNFQRYSFGNGNKCKNISLSQSVSQWKDLESNRKRFVRLLGISILRERSSINFNIAKWRLVEKWRRQGSIFIRTVWSERGALIIVVRRSWVGSNRKRSYDSRLAIVVRCTLDTICWTYLEKRGKSRLRYLESPGDCPADVAMKIVCEKKLDESYIDEEKILKIGISPPPPPFFFL